MKFTPAFTLLLAGLSSTAFAADEENSMALRGNSPEHVVRTHTTMTVDLLFPRLDWLIFVPFSLTSKTRIFSLSTDRVVNCKLPLIALKPVVVPRDLVLALMWKRNAPVITRIATRFSPDRRISFPSLARRRFPAPSMAMARSSRPVLKSRFKSLIWKEKRSLSCKRARLFCRWTIL